MTDDLTNTGHVRMLQNRKPECSRLFCREHFSFQASGKPGSLSFAVARACVVTSGPVPGGCGMLGLGRKRRPGFSWLLQLRIDYL